MGRDQGCHLARHFDEQHLPDRRRRIRCSHHEGDGCVRNTISRRHRRLLPFRCRISVSTAPKQVPLDEAASYSDKSYEPTHHKNALIAKIHPHHRFLLTKAEMETLNDRLRTLQAKKGYAIPKGMDPNRPQKISPPAARCAVADRQHNQSHRSPESVQSVPGLRHMSHNRVHIHPPTSPVNTHCPRCGHLYLLPR